MTSASPVLDSKTVFGTQLPDAVKLMIDEYCDNTKPVSKANDPDKAYALRVQLMDFINQTPDQAAEVLRAVRQQRGEVRGLLMGVLQGGKQGASSYAETLIKVIEAQRNDTLGKWELKSDHPDFQASETVRHFHAAITFVKGTVPELSGRSTLSQETDQTPVLQLGVMYDGYHLPISGKLSVPDMPLRRAAPAKSLT